MGQGTPSSIVTHPTVNPKEVSWSDVREHCGDDQNGLIFHGISLPEELLEHIFSFLDLDSICSVNAVCRSWKSTSTNPSLFKLLYKSHGADWSEIPDSIKMAKNAWCVLFTGLLREGFSKNMITNGSGEKGLSDWVLGMEGNYDIASNFIRTESPPTGSDLLPESDSDLNVCFATSFRPVMMNQTICLGLSEEMMSLLSPFEVRFSVMVAARSDCGGRGYFRVKAQLADGSDVQVIKNVPLLMGAGQTGWQKHSFSAYFDGSQAYKDCHLFVTLSGQDTSFWAGHYGLKFSRISATMKILSPQEALIPDPEFPRTTISSQPRATSG